MTAIIIIFLAGILEFEEILSAISRQQGLQEQPSSAGSDMKLQLHRTLFQIINEQDNDLVDMLSSSLALWK